MRRTTCVLGMATALALACSCPPSALAQEAGEREVVGTEAAESVGGTTELWVRGPGADDGWTEQRRTADDQVRQKEKVAASDAQAAGKLATTGDGTNRVLVASGLLLGGSLLTIGLVNHERR